MLQYVISVPSSVVNPPTIAGERSEASASGFSLTPDEIREFQQLIAKETGVQLSTQDAWDRATELIALMRMLISPLPEDPER
jgi:hypothetical protein